LSKPSSIYSMNPSCSSVFLLVVEVATYQWAPIFLWCDSFAEYTSQKYRRPPLCPLRSRQASHTNHRTRGTTLCPLISSWQDAFPHSYRRLSVHVSSYYSINIRQHNTQRKIHSQEKTVKQNKTHTLTGVNQSITPAHHVRWNNYMHTVYSNDFWNIWKIKL